MHDLIGRSPNAEALRAELHRNDLFREAASSRLARSAADRPVAPAARSGITGRVRAAIAGWGRPVRQTDCAERA